MVRELAVAVALASLLRTKTREKKSFSKPTLNRTQKLTLFRLQKDLHMLRVGVGPRGGHARGQERERDEEKGRCRCSRRRRRRPRPRPRGLAHLLRRRHSFFREREGGVRMRAEREREREEKARGLLSVVAITGASQKDVETRRRNESS